MNRLLNYIQKEKTYFISFLIIVFGFHICYGLDVILPSNINWLMSAYHDWGQHYLGWAYFKNEPWHFPIGHIENFNYPAGTNIGYTDSIPLLALFFKTFSFLLPETFQYLGIWLLSCHLLMAYFTIKILNLYKTNLFFILFAVVLVGLNPVLIYRGLHPALCAHWLIVASIYYYIIKPSAENVNKINKRQIIILILSVLINPYLFLMVIGFNIILPLKHYYIDKKLPLKKVIYFIFISVFSVFISWFILGMISFDNKVNMEVTNSYGLYSFNLNSLYNAQGFSTFLPQYPLVRDQQYEGFAYLGLGFILLLIISVAHLIITNFSNTKTILQKHQLLIFLALITSVFAITNIVTFNQNTILEFWIPSLIIKLGGIFRACGRFIWVVYYLILYFLVLYFIRIKMSDKIKIPILAVIVLIQIYDTKTLFIFRDLPCGDFQMKKISEQKWTKITSNFKKIVTYPPFNNNLISPLDYQDLCFVALKNRIPITTGYVARDTGDLNKKFSDSLDISLSEAIIDENDLYITSPNHLDVFISLIYSKKVELRYSDGYYYMYSIKNRGKIKVQKTPLEQYKTDSIYKKIKSDNKIFNIPKPQFQTGKIKINIEKNTFNNNILQVKGWAFLDDTKDNKTDSIYIALSNDEKTYLSKARTISRPDVTGAFKKGNIDNSGFSATIFTSGLEDKVYDLTIAIKTKNNEWTFEKIDGTSKIDLKKENPPKLIYILPKNQEKIICNIEKVTLSGSSIYINGWAAIEKQNSKNSTIKLIFINGKTIYEAETDKSKREDVSAYFKNTYDYNDSGFNLVTKKENIKKGKYKIGLVVKLSNKESFYLTDKEIEIK
jgi:hypothetical protein